LSQRVIANRNNHSNHNSKGNIAPVTKAVEMIFILMQITKAKADSIRQRDRVAA
jgi:hypothetical protein